MLFMLCIFFLWTWFMQEENPLQYFLLFWLANTWYRGIQMRLNILSMHIKKTLHYQKGLLAINEGCIVFTCYIW